MVTKEERVVGVNSCYFSINWANLLKGDRHGKEEDRTMRGRDWKYLPQTFFKVKSLSPDRKFGLSPHQLGKIVTF